MKPFEDLNLTAYFQQYKLLSFVQLLENTFKLIEVPEKDGIILQSFADQNLVDLGNGNVVIQVDTLENQVSLGAEPNQVFLRKHPASRTLEFSNDGVNWQTVGSDQTLTAFITHYLLINQITTPGMTPCYKGWIYPFNTSWEMDADSLNATFANGAVVADNGELPWRVSIMPLDVIGPATLCTYLLHFVGAADAILDTDITLSISLDSKQTWTPLPLLGGKVMQYPAPDNDWFVAAKTALTVDSAKVSPAVRVSMPNAAKVTTISGVGYSFS